MRNPNYKQNLNAIDNCLRVGQKVLLRGEIKLETDLIDRKARMVTLYNPATNKVQRSDSNAWESFDDITIGWGKV